MRNTPISLDEHERLNQIPIKEEVDKLFRLGKIQATLKDDDRDCEIVIRKRKHTVEFKVIGYHNVKTSRHQRCDLGHSHNVIEEQLFVYKTVELPLDKVRKLAKWLYKLTKSER